MSKIMKKIDKTNLLILLSILSAGTLLIANLSATKLCNFFGIAVDGGIVIFPLAYVLGDIVMEFYGQEKSRKITYASFFINVLASFTFFIVSILPSHPEWDGQAAFEAILGSTPRIILASLTAYLVSQLLNIYIFEKIRHKTNGKYLLLRTVGSSIVARLFDVIIFDLIAFFGILPVSDFIHQVIFAYFAGMLLEIVLSPLTVLCVSFFRKRLSNQE